MLWLWYEDMKTHHEQVVRKVAEFLGIEDDQAIKVSAKRKQQVTLEHPSFLPLFFFYLKVSALLFFFWRENRLRSSTPLSTI